MPTALCSSIVGLSSNHVSLVATRGGCKNMWIHSQYPNVGKSSQVSGRRKLLRSVPEVIWFQVTQRSLGRRNPTITTRIIIFFFMGNLQESYNTPLEHTPSNPPSQLWKKSLFSSLGKVWGCVPKVCWNNLWESSPKPSKTMPLFASEPVSWLGSSARLHPATPRVLCAQVTGLEKCLAPCLSC